MRKSHSGHGIQSQLNAGTLKAIVNAINENSTPHFDVAIIGGGIHGAGVAQACAAAGYNTAIFERGNWASGTSCKSSKLIHGGLRYLESAQLKLVHECLQERAILLRNAPELVRPIPFHIPVYTTTQRQSWLIACGLMLYRILGGFSTLSKFGLAKDSAFDGLKKDGLKRVFRYFDAQTDDRELTRAVIASAQSLGATAKTDTELLAAKRQDDVWQLDFQSEQTPYACTASVCINAAGPWVNRVAERISDIPAPPSLALVKGSHLLMPGELEHGVYYVEAPQDGRAVLIMPRDGNTLIGTTEQVVSNPDDVSVSDGERQYLLDVYKHYFPGRDQTPIEEWAGLRVLPAGDGKAFSRSRETLYVTDSECSPSGKPTYVAIYGGKLTSYRHTAEQVCKRVAKGLGPREALADTKELSLVPVAIDAVVEEVESAVVA